MIAMTTKSSISVKEALGRGDTDVSMDIRDDRVILYVPTFVGKGIYRYIARAVTMGDFQVPVVAAESMYDPGIYSRNGSGRRIVGDKKGG